jgi:hypothetical protein
MHNFTKLLKKNLDQYNITKYGNVHGNDSD